MPRDPASTLVGPVLESGDVGRALAGAIVRENAAAQVRDHGSYLRVLCPDHCRVTRAAIEHALGRGFVLPGELEQVMPSFRGRLRIDEEGAEWTLP